MVTRTVVLKVFPGRPCRPKWGNIGLLNAALCPLRTYAFQFAVLQLQTSENFRHREDREETVLTTIKKLKPSATLCKTTAAFRRKNTCI